MGTEPAMIATNLCKFARCLFLILQLTIWMPFQRLEIWEKQRSTSRMVEISKRRTRALYAARTCSSDAFFETPRISWASMIKIESKFWD